MTEIIGIFKQMFKNKDKTEKLFVIELETILKAECKLNK